MAIGNGSFAKDTRVGGFPYGDDQGMRHIVGAVGPGVSLIPLKIVSGGTGSDTIVFANLGLPNMENASYVVIAQGETAARVTVEEATITPRSCVILGGAAAEVIHVLVVGAQQGQATE
jgi:hypothetical protein